VVRYDIASDGSCTLRLSGDWRLTEEVPDFSETVRQIEQTSTVRNIGFSTDGLGKWDSSLLNYVLQLLTLAKSKGIAVDVGGLPSGVRALVDLATAVPKDKSAAKQAVKRSLVENLGQTCVDFAEGTGDLVDFIGESVISLFRWLTGRARYRQSDLWLFIQQAGADALPIVSLISLLQGLSMAYLGAAQLKLFGAQIFVANMIGISMAAEIGAVMTAIIMAGRTGAAYAAQLGSMQVSQEIDALKSIGLNPMDYLVLPRMLALILMMPLLYLYSNLLGMFGGGVVAVNVLGLTTQQYLTQLYGAVPLSLFVTGLTKAAVFGLLVAMCGCLKGLQCGRSASAVGDATTQAVVMSIIAIIIANGIFAVVDPPLSLK
jgi:phospholipid/cholesterol/gamma-HCH transport system permease protein